MYYNLDQEIKKTYEHYAFMFTSSLMSLHTLAMCE